jgi:hypothetical protein
MVEVHQDSFLTPIGDSFYKGRHKVTECVCKLCGNNTIVDTSNLKLGKSLSCGCLTSLLPKKDRTAQVTETGVQIVGYLGESLWKFKYTCGHTSVARIASATGNTTGLCNKCSKVKVTKCWIFNIFN